MNLMMITTFLGFVLYSPSLTGGYDNGFGADDGGIVTRHRIEFDNAFSPIYTITL